MIITQSAGKNTVFNRITESALIFCKKTLSKSGEAFPWFLLANLLCEMRIICLPAGFSHSPEKGFSALARK
jgi:hypothetical protein